MTPEGRRDKPGKHEAAPFGADINRPEPPVPRGEQEPGGAGPDPETQGHPRPQEPLGQGVEPKQRSVPGHDTKLDSFDLPSESYSESGGTGPADETAGGASAESAGPQEPPVPRGEQQPDEVGRNSQTQSSLRPQEPIGHGVERAQFDPAGERLSVAQVRSVALLLYSLAFLEPSEGIVWEPPHDDHDVKTLPAETYSRSFAREYRLDEELVLRWFEAASAELSTLTIGDFTRNQERQPLDYWNERMLNNAQRVGADGLQAPVYMHHNMVIHGGDVGVLPITPIHDIVVSW